MGRLPSCCNYWLRGICYHRLQYHPTFKECGLEGYLVEWVRFQLVGEDAPQVRIDLSKFILTPLYMSNAEYVLWSPGMANVNRLKEELNYDEFNRTRPMPSLTVKVLLFLPILSIPTLFFCILVHSDIQLKYLYQDAPIPSIPIDPFHLPWTIYAYGPDNFTKERPVPHNTNVMGYPFPNSTRKVSSLSFLSSLLLFLLHLSTAHSNSFSFKFQPTIQEHKELVWLARNLKLEVT